MTEPEKGVSEAQDGPEGAGPVQTPSGGAEGRPGAQGGNRRRLQTEIRRRRRKAGEFGTAAASIRNHCLEYVCYNAEEVRLCTAPMCWLYPWRFGAKPGTPARRGEKADF